MCEQSTGIQQQPVAMQAKAKLPACPICCSRQEEVLTGAQEAVLAQYLLPVASSHNQCHFLLAEGFS